MLKGFTDHPVLQPTSDAPEMLSTDGAKRLSPGEIMLFTPSTSQRTCTQVES